MNRQVVLTAVGADRPGLVGQLTGYLHEIGANVADSRMVNLRGQFALIVLVEVDEAKAAALADDITQRGEAMGLTVVVAAHGGAGQAGAGAGLVSGAGAGGVPYRLKTYAMDQPGIVHRITHLLHQHEINIEELETRLEAGSYSGTPLFTMDLRMTLPTGLSIKRLRVELEALCDELNCDADLEPA